MTQPPLPARTAYWHDSADRQRFVTALFDRSARHYDNACAIMSFGAGQRYRRDALQRSGVRPGMRVLDTGTGTGLLIREILHLLGSSSGVVGIDPSFQMLESGRDQQRTPIVQGVAERLPFPDASFDFVTMGYALRHIPDLDQTFEEFRRVLKPGGRMLLLEITRPQSKLGMFAARVYFGGIVPVVTWVGTGSTDAAELMRFYWDTIVRCVPPEVILDSLDRTGFAKPTRTLVHGIFSEYTADKV